jgi:hypothetical protein
MIVRILGEGQLDVPIGSLGELNRLDVAVQDACGAEDPIAFGDALAALLGQVRSIGSPRSDDAIERSDLVLPSADASLAEVKELMTEEGLIPG